MESLWDLFPRNAALGEGKDDELVIYAILGAVYFLGELWSCYATWKTCKSFNIAINLFQMLFYLSFHLCLICRTIYLVEVYRGKLSGILYYVITHGSVIAKDLFSLSYIWYMCFSIAGAMEEKELPVPRFIELLSKYLGYFIGAYTFTYIVLAVLNTVELLELHYVAIFCASMQFIYTCAYLYVLHHFIKNTAPAPEMRLSDKDMQILSTSHCIAKFMVRVLFVRIGVNIGEFLEFQPYLEKHWMLGLVLYRCSFFSLVELVPCLLISTYFLNFGEDMANAIQEEEPKVKVENGAENNGKAGALLKP